MKLKQRVIGAVLLTTVAVIVLPMLLDGSAEERSRINATIPDAPKIELKSLTVEDVKNSMREMEAASAAKLPVDKPTEKLPLEELEEAIKSKDTSNVIPDTTPAVTQVIDLTVAYQLDKNDLPVSWSLQLGSFRKKENAVNLRKALRDSRYRSYILKASTADNDVFRVFVGPLLNIKKLKAFAEKIESSFDMKGQIVRYKIEDDVNQLEG
jgi:DedD protein